MSLFQAMKKATKIGGATGRGRYGRALSLGGAGRHVGRARRLRPKVRMGPTRKPFNPFK